MGVPRGIGFRFAHSFQDSAGGRRAQGDWRGAFDEDWGGVVFVRAGKRIGEWAGRLGSCWPLFVGWLLLIAVDLLFVRGPEVLIESSAGVRFLTNQAISLLVLLAILTVLAPWARSPRLRWAVAVGLALPLVVQDSHFQVYREFLAGFGIRFFFSNPLLTLTAGADVLPWWRSPILLIVVFFVVSLLKRVPELGRWTHRFALLGVVAGVPLLALHWYCFPTHQNAIPSFYAALVEAGKGIHVRALARDKQSVPDQGRGGSRPDIVWVIGESLSAGHMGIFGYGRPTTPNLNAMQSRREVVAFPDATSIGTHTRISVPYMLVGISGIDPYGRVFRQPTIFDYAAARGYHTGLLSAQDLKWGDMDSLLAGENVTVFKSGNSFSPNVSVHRGADDLVVLSKGVSPFLSAAPSPYLLVVQMDGSHYPYAEHSPREFKKFLPEESPNSLNAYDNTVLYSDHYFSKLLEVVRARSPNAWVFFVSDHGENLTNLDGMFHYRFSKNLVKVPLLVFPPAGYEGALRDNREKPAAQEDIFATVLELMGAAPVASVDGLSLLGTLPAKRTRMVSAYMSTLEQDPAAYVVMPDGSAWHLDFVRGNARQEKNGTAIPFSELPGEVRSLFESRLRE